ncbi:hypothetical protein HWV62_40721 [Athelia sp. TMB]|nr:hypothetical protein HWV62_40721 [Athelia sp. TMB]
MATHTNVKSLSLDTSVADELSAMPFYDHSRLSTAVEPCQTPFAGYPPRGRAPAAGPPYVACPGSKSTSRSSFVSESSSDTTSSESPTARSRRAPSPSRTPPMHVTTTSSGYTLNAQLPIEIQPEMITVSAKKGDRIAVVADVWHMEADCE